jgi:hypothetical protein
MAQNQGKGRKRMISITERLGQPEEALKTAFDAFDFDLRCAAPGIIQSFDAEKQTVEVLLATTEMIRCNALEFVKEYGDNVAPIPVPLLVDVPICVPSAGGFSLTLPISVGDECLVIFSDTCIDGWYENGCPDNTPQDQKFLRRHDLSDAFAILGIRSQPKVLMDYSTSTAQLRNEAGDGYIEIGPEGINLVFGESRLTVGAGGIVCESEAINLEASGAIGLKGSNTIIQERDFMLHFHYGVKTGGDVSGVPA